MVQNIRRVSKSFRPMRQEDAHEYLRMLLDCMHMEVLKAHAVKLSDGAIAETTLFSRIFGGYLRNELKCGVCGYCSQTFNHFMDLSIDIMGQRLSSVVSGVEAFICPEKLGHGNEWKCEKCNKKVPVR